MSLPACAEQLDAAVCFSPYLALSSSGQQDGATAFDCVAFTQPLQRTTEKRA